VNQGEFILIKNERHWHHRTEHTTIARTLCRFEQCDIVLLATKYFSSNFACAISIPKMADHLQISLEDIEYAFDAYKRKTAAQALLEYRLNRLCDQMYDNPEEEISPQMTRCGLVDFKSTNTAFESCFGIDIVEYHKQCLHAAALRIIKDANQHSYGEEFVCDTTDMISKQTRFHREK
jgi:transcriptional regulator GlxA family with amidase domain